MENMNEIMYLSKVEFFVVTGDFVTKEGELNYESSDTRIYPFSFVDGLSIRQFLDYFNDDDRSHGMGIAAYLIDETCKFTDKPITGLGGILIPANRLSANLDKDFTKFCESAFIRNLLAGTYQTPLFSPESVVATFCTRFCGKDISYIKSLKKQKKSNYE